MHSLSIDRTLPVSSEQHPDKPTKAAKAIMGYTSNWRCASKQKKETLLRRGIRRSPTPKRCHLHLIVLCPGTLAYPLTLTDPTPSPEDVKGHPSSSNRRCTWLPTSETVLNAHTVEFNSINMRGPMLNEPCRQYYIARSNECEDERCSYW